MYGKLIFFLTAISLVVIDAEAVPTTGERVKRGGATLSAVVSSMRHFGPKEDSLSEITYGSRTCGKKGGCHKGYCWAGCDATLAINEWCYTTRGYSQDFQYVSCSRDSHCDKCWSCAGSCTV